MYIICLPQVGHRFSYQFCSRQIERGNLISCAILDAHKIKTTNYSLRYKIVFSSIRQENFHMEWLPQILYNIIKLFSTVNYSTMNFIDCFLYNFYWHHSKIQFAKAICGKICTVKKRYCLVGSRNIGILRTLGGLFL